MDLSVIIVSYNVRYFLEQCLLSVQKALAGIEGEIIVADNCSTDNSCSVIEERFPEVRLIKNQTNRGFSAANNQALGIASGRYLVLLNPDTLVGGDTFRKCIAFMDSHPDAGAAGVMMIDGRGRFLPESKRSVPTPSTSFFRITGLWRLFPKSSVINRYYVGNIDNEITAKIEVVSGAFMFINGEAYRRVGPLDEDYFMYGEDVDYSFRLIKSGFSNYYFPETRIIHFKGESTRKQDLNVVANFYMAMLIFVRKHLAGGKLNPFIFIVRIAIFLRASLSFLKRILRKIFLPDKLKKNRSSARGKNQVIVSVNDLDNGPESLRNLLIDKKAGEVIFSPGCMNITRIIEAMQFTADLGVTFRFSAQNNEYIIGSRFVSCK